MEFMSSQIVFALGISLFVLGFALGPLLWAPLSEIFGRQIIFLITYAAMTAFNGGAIGAQNIETLVICRFFSGAFGASPLTNAGGVIADMFPARDREFSLPVKSKDANFDVRRSCAFVVCGGAVSRTGLGTDRWRLCW